MTLRLYNTLTRQKEVFEPIDPGNVRLYACGPTVYDYLHIGNGRMLIVFDVLFRLLRHLYGESRVTYVRNITDVDDKINARAAERGVDIRVLTNEMTAVFHEDARALGCLPPSVEPRATDHIGEIIAIIQKLIANGHAYAAEGHVLFDVHSMPSYGKLSRRSLDDMIAGARVEVAPYKRGPMDFVLWKPSAPNEPGWDSPWGRGRPGWHIECSAMSWKHLGEVFDIHGGGIDLVFPHHENEIAQSCSAFGHDVMANFWVHNGHLQVEGQKMAKSLGNFVTIHELLNEEKFGGRSWLGEVLRLALLGTHYRQPLDFTVKALQDARNELRLWARALENESAAKTEAIKRKTSGTPPKPAQSILKALLDDLNTPLALTELRAIFSRLHDGDHSAAIELIESCEFLGLLRPELLGIYQERYIAAGPRMVGLEHRSLLDEIYVAVGNQNEIRKEKLIAKLEADGITVKIRHDGTLSYGVANGVDIDALIAARNAARASKNWAEADRIRAELDAMGIILKDNKDGTTSWEAKR
jgi:cysteinyl-tRNA synthetase